MNDQKDSSGSHWTRLLKRLHGDEQGGASIETILIIAAVAIPILIFILKFGWPRIKSFFERGMQNLEQGSSDAATGNTN